MPCRLLASIIVLLIWPIQAGLIGLVDSWLGPVGILTRVSTPLFSFALLSVLFWGSSRLICRYRDVSSPLRLWHDRLAQCLSPRGYAWLPLLASALAIGAVVLSLYLAGWEHFINVTAMLVVALAGLWDLTPAPDIQLATDLPPQPIKDFIQVEPLSEDGKSVTVRWNVNFDDVTAKHEVKLTIPESEYESHRNRTRLDGSPVNNYGFYVSEGLSPSVHKLASELRNYTNLQNLSSLEEALCAVSIARCIPYARDTETHDAPNWADYPVELLYDERGDCEDHAILAAALLHLLGHTVALYWIELDHSAHIALGYHAPFENGPLSLADEKGTVFHYVETVPVGSNYQLGDMPSEFLAELRNSKIINIPANTLSPKP